MTDDACPLPAPTAPDEDAIIRQLLQARRIAIVGLSNDTSRPSHEIGRYLLEQGYEILPVNPNHSTVLGRRCYRSLAEITDAFDIVNVFRRPGFCEGVTREAIAAGARGVWLQAGITNQAAAQLAADAGIPFIQNRCIMVEHTRRK